MAEPNWNLFIHREKIGIKLKFLKIKNRIENYLKDYEPFYIFNLNFNEK